MILFKDLSDKKINQLTIRKKYEEEKQIRIDSFNRKQKVFYQ